MGVRSKYAWFYDNLTTSELLELQELSTVQKGVGGIRPPSTANAQHGGHVSFTGGTGLSTSSVNGGIGGDVYYRGGLGKGANTFLNTGGAVKLVGGTALSASGGNVYISTL